MSGLWQLVALIGGTVIAVVAIALRLFNAGKRDERLKNVENQIQDERNVDSRLDEAIKHDTAVRDSIRTGDLRADDGHKRH
jgi:hypothetical protein